MKALRLYTHTHTHTNILKKNHGITLVALVVTIVVLLILAGVSINLVLGQNGLINRAKEASKKTIEQATLEKKQLSMLNASMNTSNYVYTDKNGDNAIIPVGFAPSEIEEEKTIVTGLVIIDSIGNEFVYVPINDINTMAQCELADGSCHLILDDNKKLLCKTHNSESIVGKLYASGTGEDFGEANTKYSGNSGIREPAIITGWQYKECDAVKYNFANFNSYNEMLDELKNEYKLMAESVARNGGFYIARYETGISNGNIVTSKYGETPVTAAELTNSWYDFFVISKKLSNEYITSSMIWGSQYDAMLNWAKKGEDASKVCDITGIGNNSSGKISKSGMYKNDSINNVKDLGGNLLEWTLEASNQYHRMRRGGSYKEVRSPAYRWTDGIDSTSIVLRK